jgi:hypothetical protein
MDTPSNCIFVCLKNHKGSIIIWIVIIVLKHFPLIAKFTCSKLDTNIKKNCMFKELEPQKWIVRVFFQTSFFSTKCAPFLLKIENDFNIDD